MEKGEETVTGGENCCKKCKLRVRNKSGNRMKVSLTENRLKTTRRVDEILTAQRQKETKYFVFVILKWPFRAKFSLRKLLKTRKLRRKQLRIHDVGGFRKQNPVEEIPDTL